MTDDPKTAALRECVSALCHLNAALVVAHKFGRLHERAAAVAEAGADKAIAAARAALGEQE